MCTLSISLGLDLNCSYLQRVAAAACCAEAGCGHPNWSNSDPSPPSEGSVDGTNRYMAARHLSFRVPDPRQGSIEHTSPSRQGRPTLAAPRPWQNKRFPFQQRGSTLGAIGQKVPRAGLAGGCSWFSPGLVVFTKSWGSAVDEMEVKSDGIILHWAGLDWR